MNVHATKKYVSKLYQRSIHTSFNAADTKFAEALANKFINQVNKQRQPHKSDPTRFVLIDALPATATLEDVNKLAREAFPKGDVNIAEMVFCRNFEFEFTGRCVISMDNTEDARRLMEYGNNRTLGGKLLKMHYIGNNSVSAKQVMSKHRRAELCSLADSSSGASRSVILSGLPPKARTEDVLSILRTRKFFPVDTSGDGVRKLKSKGDKSKFLVKFDSESEAWRCVRAIHNTEFQLRKESQTFKLFLNVAY